MPWNISDVSRFKKGLDDAQKEKWVTIANKVLEDCLKAGGDQKTCEAKAIKIANSQTTANYQTYKASFSYNSRFEKLEGKDYLVVPVVMMVEGVHNGSHGAILHLADELSKFPEAWNGIPVTIFHPEKDGQPISANRPDVFEERVVGRTFNSKVEDGKLKAEAWLDVEKLKKVSMEAYKYIESNYPIEVSVGVFSDEELIEGEWNGEKYEAVARNYRPDHLALLPGGKGACSWADGCGLGRYEKGGEIMEEIILNALRYNGTESTPWSAPTLKDFGVDKRWEDLSQSERARIASHFLIGSASAKTFAELHYPVVNPKTGKLNENALRAVISGRGAALKGVNPEVKSAARRRAYRLLNKEFGAKLKIPENLEFVRLEFEELFEEPLYVQKVSESEYILTNVLRKEDMKMSKKIDELIGCECTPFGSEDKEWLQNLEDSQIEKIEKMAKEVLKKKGEPQVNKEQAIQVLRESIQKSEDWIEVLPDDLKESVSEGIKMYEAKKAEMVKKIMANSDKFQEDELKTMSLSELDKLASLIKEPADYSGVNGGKLNVEEPKVLPVGVK